MLTLLQTYIYKLRYCKAAFATKCLLRGMIYKYHTTRCQLLEFLASY